MCLYLRRNGGFQCQIRRASGQQIHLPRENDGNRAKPPERGRGFLSLHREELLGRGGKQYPPLR